MADLDKLIDGLKTDLEAKYGEKVAAEVEKVRIEMKDLTDAQAEAIKNESGEVSSLAKKLEEKDAQLTKFAEDLAETKNHLDELNKASGRMGMGSGSETQTMGETFVESEDYKALLKRHLTRTEPVETKSFLEQKALTNLTTGWGNAGLLIDPQQLSEMIRKPQPNFNIRQLFRVFPTTSSSVEWTEMTGFKNLYAELTANAGSTATTLALDSTAGFYAGQNIDVNGTAAVVLTVDSATQITLSAQIGAAKSSGEPVVSDELGFTPHGGLKPQANIKFAEQSEPVGTIAHWIPVHKQTLEDVPVIQGVINTEMVAGLDLALDKQLLYGPGGSPNLTGIMNKTGVQDAGTQLAAGGGAGTAGSGTEMFDHIRKMIRLARMVEYPPDFIAVYPTDWEKMEIAKDSTGDYLQVLVRDGRDSRLWRLPVFETLALKPKRVLVGSAQFGAYLLDREQASIQVSDSHSDFFTRNMVAILAEARVGLAYPRPESFVKGTFA